MQPPYWWHGRCSAIVSLVNRKCAEIALIERQTANCHILNLLELCNELAKPNSLQIAILVASAAAALGRFKRLGMAALTGSIVGLACVLADIVLMLLIVGGVLLISRHEGYRILNGRSTRSLLRLFCSLCGREINRNDLLKQVAHLIAMSRWWKDNNKISFLTWPSSLCLSLIILSYGRLRGCISILKIGQN